MAFYDSTPIRRILSRVSSDLSIVDLDLCFKIHFGSWINHDYSFLLCGIVCSYLATLASHHTLAVSDNSLAGETLEVVEGNRPAPNWPTTGKVEIYDLQIRYWPNAPFVLHGITCTFKGGHKIGSCW
ncbi:hypothetical protein Patl1_17587 [Pistacia atlantica]|uniref:Uncharacterized protein n=1 Tax=Pistacia atlantica TaxID=434234 RepID=A0ACC1C2T7_9ROSI|nr:hypothetical protein Patl1_17587 [Pistacia atlantica]